MIMELEGYIACICEGSAEQAIMDLLLESMHLVFLLRNVMRFDKVI